MLGGVVSALLSTVRFELYSLTRRIAAAVKTQE